MKSIWLIDKNGSRRKVSIGPEIHSGGAGSVHPVTENSSWVVKLYHPQTLASEGSIYAQKIRHMVQNPPIISSSQSHLVQLAWPICVAEGAKGDFLGFSMPALNLSETESLETLIQPKQAAARGLRSDLGAKVTVATNLAGVINAVHQTGYQVVDLKPPNLQFYRDVLNVAVLDCDGFNVAFPGKRFPAPQVTSDYLAPEFQGSKISKPISQDQFALSIIIFRLINFGIHPYQSIATDPKAPTDLEGKISKGLYAYARTGRRLTEPLPVSAHQYFPDNLRQLFDRAFGSLPELRPTAREWFDLLEKFAQPRSGLIKSCQQGHFWFSGHMCGECHRNSVLNGTPLASRLKASSAKGTSGSQLPKRQPSLATKRVNKRTRVANKSIKNRSATSQVSPQSSTLRSLLTGIFGFFTK